MQTGGDSPVAPPPHHGPDLLPPDVSVREGDLLWTPGPTQVARANVTAFTRWLGETRGHDFAGYDALWRWSVTDLDGFWQAVWDYCGVGASTPPTAVLGRRTMPGAEWFPGARLNYAEHVLRHERHAGTGQREGPGGDALLFAGEAVPLQGLPWPVFAGQVRILATRLRDMGVRPGDRVASYLPNIPQTVIAMLAAASVGAVWTSCSPDFGWRGVLDRFRQVSPKVLICTDGYRYGGREFDRRAETAQIAAGLPGLEHLICPAGGGGGGGGGGWGSARRWGGGFSLGGVRLAGFFFFRPPAAKGDRAGRGGVGGGLGLTLMGPRGGGAGVL